MPKNMKDLLDFTFIAEFHSGRAPYYQSPDDKSKLDPINRSSYFDIARDVKEGRVKKFSLVGKGHIFSVDLVDGHFEIDGKSSTPKPPPAGTPLTLIYFMQVEQRIVITYKPDGSTTRQLKPVRRFYIGWHCNYEGKNHEFKMGVD